MGVTSVTGHTYLMKSRHGVYYLRLVRSLSRDQPAQKSRELRVSLRTKDKKEAKLRLVDTIFRWQRSGERHESTQMYFGAKSFDQKTAKLLIRGLEIFVEIGTPHPEDALLKETFYENYSWWDYEAYVFAYDSLIRPKERDEPSKDQRHQDARSLLSEDRQQIAVPVDRALSVLGQEPATTPSNPAASWPAPLIRGQR